MYEKELPGGSVTDLSAGSVTFIGTATVLIRCAGFTFLTDPNFIHQHEKVPLGYGLEGERLTNPAIELDELPDIDAVVLSHYHGDHFDPLVERELSKDLLILTTPHAAGELSDRGFTNTVALETWESAVLTKGGARVTLTAAPGEHGPAIADMLLPEVMGSVLVFDSPGGGRLMTLYITGDTLAIDDLAEVPRRLGDIDLALAHLGGTRVLGVLVTMDDEQGIKLISLVEPQVTVPIHYNDYDVFKSPLSDFQARVREAGMESRVRYLSHGETYDFALPWPTPQAPVLQGEAEDYLRESVTGKPRRDDE